MNKLNSVAHKNLIGLVLCGGKSTRMGYDKCLIEYHGLPQWEYIKNLLRKQGLEVFLSCGKDQVEHFKHEKCIIDVYPSIGPMGGILSAFKIKIDATFLVIACDYPLIKDNDIEWLIKHRDKGRDAIIMGKDLLNYEPTYGIYEKSSEFHFNASFEKNEYSIKRALSHMNFRILEPLHENVIKQANNPLERDRLQQMINGELI